MPRMPRNAENKGFSGILERQATIRETVLLRIVEVKGQNQPQDRRKGRGGLWETEKSPS